MPHDQILQEISPNDPHAKETTTLAPGSTFKAIAPSLAPRIAVAVVALAAGVGLALEIVSLRLVAPYVGLTLEMNTAVIGVSLSAMALGVWLGGRAADVLAPHRLVGPLVLTAGVLIFAILPLVRWTGKSLGGHGVTSTIVVASVAVFVPTALLAAVTPVIIKMRLRTLAETGSIVGALSGAGTAGSIVATFLTGFILLTIAANSVILLSLGSIVTVVGIALTVWGYRWKAVAAPAVIALLAAGASVFAPKVCDVESQYHCINVTADPQRPTGRLLQLDNLSHSYVDLSDPTHLEFGYIQAIASVVDVFRPNSAPVTAAHIGGGGFTIPKYISATRPSSYSTVFEVDRGVVRVAREKLGLADESIKVQIADGRQGLGELKSNSQDLVVGDAFSSYAVPWHLATKEFVTDIQRVLTGNGIYALNVIDGRPQRLVKTEMSTVAAVFKHVALIATPEVLAGEQGGNYVVVASDKSLPLTELHARIVARSPDLAVLAGEKLRSFVSSGQILTDDHAPVDQLLSQ